MVNKELETSVFDNICAYTHIILITIEVNRWNELDHVVIRGSKTGDIRYGVSDLMAAIGMKPIQALQALGKKVSMRTGV